MKHCGNETCRGAACEGWQKCRGETVPPWDCGPHPSTAQSSVREQDVLAAADALANEVRHYIQQGLVQLELPLDEAVGRYVKARAGARV